MHLTLCQKSLMSPVESYRLRLKKSRKVLPLFTWLAGWEDLPPDMVEKLVSPGDAKFNASPALKHTLIDTTFNYISEHREEYNPRKIDVAVKDAIREK